MTMATAAASLAWAMVDVCIGGVKEKLQQRSGDNFEHGGYEAAEQRHRDHCHHDGEHLGGQVRLAAQDGEHDREHRCQHRGQGISG